MGKPRISHLPDERDLSRGVLDFCNVRDYIAGKGYILPKRHHESF